MLVPGLTPSRPTDASAFKLLAVLFFSLITASVRSVTLVRFMGLGRIACCEEVASSVNVKEDGLSTPPRATSGRLNGIDSKFGACRPPQPFRGQQSQETL